MQLRTLMISTLVIALCFAPAVFGQKKQTSDIASWDRNQDGYLQTEEIPEKLRPQMANWALKMKLDPNQPLPLKALLKSKADVKADGKAKTSATAKPSKKKTSAGDPNAVAVAGGAGDSGVDKTSVDKTPQAKASATEAKLKKDARPGPLRRRVAGFGKDRAEKKASPQPEVGAESSDAKASDAKSSESDSPESARELRRKRRFQMLAKSLLFQHDKNKNGRLERNEWAHLQGKPDASDTNHDGVLTTEELVLHLQGYGSRERHRSRRLPSREQRAQKNAQGKSYRFLTPHERLPDGLPGWFVERDDNLDGQISLREFAVEMTQDNVVKFRRLDQNRDGFIVAREYFRATEPADE